MNPGSTENRSEQHILLLSEVRQGMQGQKEHPLLPVQKAEQEVLIHTIPGLISDQDLFVELVTAGKAASKAAEMASTAYEKVKSVLGIHSPSKVMRGAGRFSGKGFALGIDDQIPAVKGFRTNGTFGTEFAGHGRSVQSGAGGDGGEYK